MEGIKAPRPGRCRTSLGTPPLAPSPNGLGDWRGEFEALCGLEANKIDSSLKAQLGTQPLLLAWCLPSYVQWSKLGSPARLGFSICELCHTKV